MPASEVDVVVAGQRSKADPSHKEPVLDYDKEGPAATNEVGVCRPLDDPASEGSADRRPARA